MVEKLKILLIVPHYEPDLGPSAPLFTLLSTELVKRGHHVCVLTTVPHYPSGIVPPSFRTKWIQSSVENGVEIYRVRVPSMNRSCLTARMLQFIAFQWGSTIRGLLLNYDVVFAANPALWVWLPFTCLSVLRRKPAVFSVYDLYPDVGIRLGIFRSRMVIEVVRLLEKFCLQHAASVRIISESFRSGIRQFGIPNSKIRLIPDWVDTELIRPLPHHNSFTSQYNLNGHFIIQYAGNIGLSQGLDQILDAAQSLINYPDILFVLVGDGSGREKLERKAQKRNLTNLRFIPFQPRQQLAEVLAAADVSLVVLREGVAYTAMPSKILSILASGRPVIACVDQGSETWNFIQRTGAGFCVPPDNPEKFLQAILTLHKNPDLRRQMGESGRRWVLQNHTPAIAAENMEQLFLSMLRYPLTKPNTLSS
ncbi:MAG: glycosyltransferase family 4 protein [Chloroflexota bacterium]